MNNKIPSPFIALASLLLLSAAATASAQTTVAAPTGDITARTAGEGEFTIGGSGAVNTDFDDSFGGLNFSFGKYTSETLLWALRQTINYANPDSGGTSWNGSTRLALDWHLKAHGKMRPFVGVNIGGVYGDNVRDTWAAGLEGGAKFYVLPRTFIFGLVEYGWFFRQGNDIDDTFDDGQFNYSVGVGFNF